MSVFANIHFGIGQVTTAISEVCVDNLNRCMVQLEEHSNVYSDCVLWMQVFNP